ncbi:MAG: hypothetical protein WC107_01215 [Patescibacteria group bacterium]
MIRSQSAKNLRKSKSFRIIFLLLIFFFFPILNIGYAKYSDPKGKNTIQESSKLSGKGMQIRSIDTQIVSKHWENVDENDIKEQVLMIKNLGANYIAVSTPYDNPATLKLWADSIHNAGLNVWFRSHWLDWEGDNNHQSVMKVEDYLKKTGDFIQANPAFFRQGDAFTVCVEPEQVFTARKIQVFDWYGYNKFVIDQIDIANASFTEIGLSGQIHTNWISMNGWVVENGLSQEAVDKMGLITVDHYSNEKTIVPPAVLADKMASDLERMYEKWQKPIILGEWGYNIEQEVDDYTQKQTVEETLNRLSNLRFLVGINYWDHMGNSSRLINDVDGVRLEYRPSALTVRDFFQSKK